MLKGPNGAGKKKASGSSRGLGRLKRFLDIPLDVFCEVRSRSKDRSLYLIITCLFIRADIGTSASPRSPELSAIIESSA